MQKFYFVVPSLPPLSMRDRPDISFEELMARLHICLGKSDLEQVGVFAFSSIFTISARF